MNSYPSGNPGTCPFVNGYNGCEVPQYKMYLDLRGSTNYNYVFQTPGTYDATIRQQQQPQPPSAGWAPPQDLQMVQSASRGHGLGSVGPAQPPPPQTNLGGFSQPVFGERPGTISAPGDGNRMIPPPIGPGRPR